MSEDELKGIERDYGARGAGRVLKLVAEVRRLRAVVKRLEWGSCDGCGNREVCTECKARKSTPDEVTWRPLEKHAPNCPVFTEDGEVR
jgi:hypothetical protein